MDFKFLKYPICMCIVFLITHGSIIARPVPKYIRKKFTTCYGVKPDIRALLNIDGFYRASILFVMNASKYGNYPTHVDSMVKNMIFFEDGTFLDGFFDTGRIQNQETTKEFLRQVSLDASENPFHFYSYFLWGAYKISGDTIITQTVSNVKKQFIVPWEASENKYKVLNRNQLVLVDHRNFEKQTKQERAFSERDKQDLQKADRISNFVYCKYMPQPKSWLKKEKWMWCTGNIK